MVRTVTLVLVCLFALSPAAPAMAKLPREQIYSLFNQANDAFGKGNSATDELQQKKLYKKAILNFEKIINEGGIKNAKLYYNVANAYLLKGDIGKAILNYRRAEKLDSSDANIQKNLAFARSRRVDKVQVKTQKRILQTLFFWHYDFSIKTRFIVTCLCFMIVCVSLAIMVWFGRSTPLGAVTAIAGVLMLCFLVSVVIESRTSARRQSGVILAQEVVARQGDGQNYPASFKGPLHCGTEFDLLEHRPGWLHIQLADGSDGWIPENSAELI